MPTRALIILILTLPVPLPQAMEVQVRVAVMDKARSRAATSASSSCGPRREAQQVVCWGADAEGQATPPTGRFLVVSAGGRHTCGITTEDAVVCWGSNAEGQRARTADLKSVYLPLIITGNTGNPSTIFLTLGIHLGNRPGIAWNDLPDTDEPFDFLKKLDGTHTNGFFPAFVVILSDQVFRIERATTGNCDITGASIARTHVFEYLRKLSWTKAKDGYSPKILFRIAPSPGNFDDAAEKTNNHNLLLGTTTPQGRTYCEGQGQNGKRGYESFRSSTDIVNEMNAIMDFLSTYAEKGDFNTDNVYFIPANEPNIEWYEEWYDEDSRPVFLADSRVWQQMNRYFTDIYFQQHKRDDVRILTPAMAPGRYAERKNLGCQDVRVGDTEFSGYTYMRAVYESGNDGYAWNNYWSEGKEDWGDGDPCPPGTKDPKNHHIFQYFPDWLQDEIRTSPNPAFITEGSLHSPYQNGNTNPITCKDADPQRTRNSFLKFLRHETGEATGTGGADYLSVWVLTEDKLEEPKYTSCRDLNEDILETREVQWHMAYLVDGTECEWFTMLWR